VDHSERLESIVRDHIKPAVKFESGFDVVDMREVARAGIIDNLLRTQIHDSERTRAALAAKRRMAPNSATRATSDLQGLPAIARYEPPDRVSMRHGLAATRAMDPLARRR
jgi:hypothetical protein